MATVAEQLRQAREAQHLSLSQVAEITKIRTDHLSALEEGRHEVFPAPVYVRGSVRSYSTLLKLDVPRIMAALEAELGQNKKLTEGIPADEPRGIADFLMFQLSRMNPKRAMIGGGAILVGILILSIYFIWRHQSSVDPLRNLPPGLYQATQNFSGQTLPLPGGPKR